MHQHHRQADLQIVIPAFNEEQRIGPTLLGLADYLAQQEWTSSIVVVDNGSSDSTSDVVDRVEVASVPITIVGCSRQGKGAAVRRGVLHGQSKWVGFCDADGATPFRAIGQAIERLEAGAEVVAGSRRIAGASYVASQPVKRRVAGAVFRYLVRPVVPTIVDTQCGFKFFSRCAADLIFSRAEINGFAFDVEVLALARHLELAVAELPVDWSDVGGSTLNLRAHGRPLLRDIRHLRETFSVDTHLAV